MEKFSEKIKGKVDKLNHSYTKKELKGIEHQMADFEKDEREITDNLRKVDYLLGLIEHHDVNEVEITDKEVKIEYEKYLLDLENDFERIYKTSKEELTKSEIELLETEKNKLEAEKKRLARDQKYILSLIAQANVYLMEARETTFKEYTNGYGITEVSEKLVDHFGKKSELTVYEVGRRDMIKFIEKTFSIGRIDAHKAFNILENSEVVKFVVDISSLEYMSYNNYMSMEYTPVFGNWFINA